VTRTVFKRINDVLGNEGIDRESAFKSLDIDQDNKIGARDLSQAFLLMNLKHS
jgi:hypothetical protein